MSTSKAPFQILYNNDFANIEICTSPFHKKDQPFEPEMLDASVKETADIGVDVHLLTPGFGWVPMWQSKVYSPQEHCDWFEKKYGQKPSNNYSKYLLSGGDFVEDFITACRKYKLSPFISFRLNDGHMLEYANLDLQEPGTLNSLPSASNYLSKFYSDNFPNYCIGPDPKSWNGRVQNWAIPEVRNYKFSLIEELCRNYDFDGLELDFMRHINYFRLEETTSQQRCRIMTKFVTDIRRVLDETSQAGQRRWLCVRVPCFLEEHDYLGIDLPAMVHAGVDVVTLSSYYFTNQYTDLSTIRKQLPQTSIYLEMTDAHSINPVKGAYYTDFEPTTDLQFYTTADLAYQQGADGVSLFNFAFYRTYKMRSPDAEHLEPPFHIIEKLRQPAWLSKQPKDYFLGRGWGAREATEKITYSRHCFYPSSQRLPADISCEQSVGGDMQLSPSCNTKTNAILQVFMKKPVGDSQFDVLFNGQKLEIMEDSFSPPDIFAGCAGDSTIADAVMKWKVETSLFGEQDNHVEIILSSGPANTIVFLDLLVW